MDRHQICSNDYGNAPGTDPMVVDISNDAGLTWTHATAGFPATTRHNIDTFQLTFSADGSWAVADRAVERRIPDKTSHTTRRARCIPALLKAAYGDRPTRQVHAGRGDLDQLGGPAAGEVQRLAQRAVAGRLAPGRGQEGGAFLGVQIEPASSRVMEAHLAHENSLRVKS